MIRAVYHRLRVDKCMMREVYHRLRVDKCIIRAVYHRLQVHKYDCITEKKGQRAILSWPAARIYLCTHST